MPRILVIDGADVVRGPLIDLLRCMGHDAVGVPSGAHALIALSARDPFDLLIIDLDVEFDSDEHVVTLIRRYGFRMPIVLMGSAFIDQAIDRVIRDEIASLIKKPFDVNEVLDVVTAAVSAGGRG